METPPGHMVIHFVQGNKKNPWPLKVNGAAAVAILYIPCTSQDWL
jgi:hypothetical protein